MSEERPTWGWPADPDGPDSHRHWEGTEQSRQSSSAAGWGPPGRAPGTGLPGHGDYVPATSEVTNSGMRHVPKLFDDVGRIITRAWWPILVVSFVLWYAWLALAIVMVALVVDIGRGVDAVTSVLVENQMNDGRWSAAGVDRVEGAFELVPRTDSPAVLLGVAALLALSAVVVGCVHIATVNRFGMNAAAGLPVTWSDGVRVGVGAGLRLAGYAVVLILLTALVALAVVGVVAASASLSPVLAALAGVTAFITFCVVATWLTGRLIPATVQVDMGRHALAWAWARTRGRFWAVLGRYLLWVLVASTVGQIAATVVSVPISVLGVAATSQPDPASVWLWIALSVLSWPLSMVVSALTYVGVVPIWRDLTDAPQYRSIGPDGALTA